MIARTLALALFACAVPAAAQTAAANDPIYAGYMRLYAGEREAADKHFEGLRASDPKSLAAWFGQLFAQETRVDFEPALAPAFETSMAAFLDQAEQRYSRSHADAEALFYLGQGYLLRGTYRLDHDKGMWGAARDAAKAKGYADTYIKQHPEHGDAYLGLGLYNYYVGIAPNFIKVLRVLLLLPSGSRSEGMTQLERAGRDGSYFAPLAEAALADIYSSFEGRLGDAITIGETLVQRFPTSADLRFDLAQRYMHPAVEAYDRAAAQYTMIVEQKNGSSIEHLEARYRATLGLANLRRSQWRMEEAIALLTTVIEQRIAKPEWVSPMYLIRRANYRALVNDPGAAGDAERVVADKRMATWHKAAQGQLAFIAARKKSGEGAVYASLIPGNRLVVEHRWDDAAAVYDSVAASHPGDWQVKYRRAYLEFMRGSYGTASQGFNEIATSNAPVPSWLKAAAMLNLGWTHDIAGRRAEALKLYKRVVDDYENEAASGAARVGLISPYRRSV